MPASARPSTSVQTASVTLTSHGSAEAGAGIRSVGDIPSCTSAGRSLRSGDRRGWPWRGSSRSAGPCEAACTTVSRGGRPHAPARVAGVTSADGALLRMLPSPGPPVRPSGSAPFAPRRGATSRGLRLSIGLPVLPRDPGRRVRPSMTRMTTLPTPGPSRGAGSWRPHGGRHRDDAHRQCLQPTCTTARLALPFTDPTTWSPVALVWSMCEV